MSPRTVSVKVRCIGCKATADIKAGDVKRGEHPVCKACFMPMVPAVAVSEIERITR